MDQTALVEETQRLVSLLDEAKTPPRVAILVYDNERGSWRLWLVPCGKSVDKHEFYRQISSIIVKNKSKFSALDVGNIDLRAADYPPIKGLNSFARVEGFGAVQMSNNMLNGFFLPDCIIIRLAL